MRIENNKLILSYKRSEKIEFIAELGTEYIDFTTYDSIICDIKEVENINAKVIYTVNIASTVNQLTFSVPSSTTEKLPNQCFFDIKGIKSDVVDIFLQGKITLAETVTKAWN